MGDELVGEIGTGLCVFVGVTHDDGPAQAARLVDKLAGLRPRGLEGATGRFQADMVGDLANEGPATLMLEV